MADTTTTQTTYLAPPTDTMVTTATLAADHLDHRKPTSPSFTMNAITENRLGATANPLLIVNTENDGNMNIFITLTLVINCYLINPVLMVN